MSELGNGRDPVLLGLFSDAQLDLEGDEFATRVVARTRNFTWLVVGGCVALAVAAVSAAWMFGVPFEFAQLLGEVLTRPLVQLSEGWLAWIVSPINNIGGLLLIVARAARTVQKRIRNR